MHIDNDVLQECIESWDTYQNELLQGLGFPRSPEEQAERRAQENFHKRLSERLTFLSKHFYSAYDLNQPRLFDEVFFEWLSQFDFEVENPVTVTSYQQELRYAFILASKLLFFNRPQVLSLAHVVWSKVKQELLSNVMLLNGSSIFDVFETAPLIKEELFSTLFAPLSDSSKFEEFRHNVMPKGMHGQVTIQHIELLTKPIEDAAKSDAASHYVEYLKESYKDKKSLYIVEDFSGSGTSIIRKIRTILSAYSFDTVYFCPLIITEQSLNNINDEISKGSFGGKAVKVLHGLIVKEMFSLSSGKPGCWEEDEVQALLKMSRKYFNSHFNENRFLYDDCYSMNPEKPTPYGFKNGGYPIILYTNCPNNSLPIVWGFNNSWHPLFLRDERYYKELEIEKRKTVSI